MVDRHTAEERQQETDARQRATDDRQMATQSRLNKLEARLNEELYGRKGLIATFNHEIGILQGQVKIIMVLMSASVLIQLGLLFRGV